MYALTSDELLSFCSTETDRWHKWFAENPAALDLSLDIAQGKTVRDLVLHIVVVELRYAERLLEEPVTDYEAAPKGSVDELFSNAQRSAEKLRRFIQNSDDAEWAKLMVFPTRSYGSLSGSKRKIFVHALLHGMRHWAQLATFFRQHGRKQPWLHDFIFSDVIP